MDKNTKITNSFEIINDKGLHTRPATELVKCAQTFKSEILLVYQGLNVSAKSLLGILMLAASCGAKIDIEAEGNDAEDAVNAILSLAEQKFNISY